MEVILIAIPFFLYIYLRIRLNLDITPQERDGALFAEGITLFNTNQELKAFRYFEAVIEKYPKSATAFFYRAKCHYFFENWEAALADFEKTIRFDNSIAEAYHQKANCYLQLEQYSMALYELKRSSRFFLDKNPEVLRQIGELEFRSGDFESAEKYIKIASELGDDQSKKLLKILLLGNIRNSSK